MPVDSDVALPSRSSIDFDVLGILRIRASGAGSQEARALARQLGTSAEPATGSADLCIRFDLCAATAGLSYAGHNAAAFSDDAFYVLDPATGDAALELPFDQLGTCLNLRCRPGARPIPLLADLLTFAALAKGYVSLHASAFEYRGCNALVVGWAQGGKTETLLAFTNEGARYVGDEAVLLSADGERMYGLPAPVTLRDWLIRQMTRHRPRLDARHRIIFTAVNALRRLNRWLAPTALARSLPGTLLAEAATVLSRKLKYANMPSTLFGDAVALGPATVDVVFLVISADVEDVQVEPCEPAEIIARMAHSNDYERSYLLQHYRAFRFAFPERRNAFLDGVDAEQGARLAQALAARRTFKIRHPYPVSLDALYAAAAPYCAAGE